MSAEGARSSPIGSGIGAKNDLEAAAHITALREGLGVLGWTEGRNLEIEYRLAAAIPVASNHMLRS